jgi:hypothetical protein
MSAIDDIMRNSAIQEAERRGVEAGRADAFEKMQSTLDSYKQNQESWRKKAEDFEQALRNIAIREPTPVRGAKNSIERLEQLNRFNKRGRDRRIDVARNTLAKWGVVIGDEQKNDTRRGIREVSPHHRRESGRGPG